jgi:hypothetical protein
MIRLNSIIHGHNIHNKNFMSGVLREIKICALRTQKKNINILETGFTDLVHRYCNNYTTIINDEDGLTYLCECI